MIKENIYVAINHNDEIQWVQGSSSKTRYFRTDRYLKNAVEYHNKYHPEDIWKVRKCLILEEEPKTGHCKDCKWWKDSDGFYRRGGHAESQCPINRKEVFEGIGYCYMFEPQKRSE